MRVVYVDRHGRIGSLEEPLLDATTERHSLSLPAVAVAAGDPVAALARDPALGLIIEVGTGCPSHRQIRLATRGLKLGRRVWHFWSRETVVECADWDRLGSYRRQWLLINFFRLITEPVMRAVSGPRRLAYALHGMPPRSMPGWILRRVRQKLFRPDPQVPRPNRLRALRAARQAAKAVPFPAFAQPDPRHPIRGCGVYLRTDFWSPAVSGGSYGHTCYVAKELAATTESLVCLMANRFPLIDELGLRQIVMPRPGDTDTEDDIATATPHYLNVLRPVFKELEPAYIYERYCLGNSAGALLSAEFSVPYILEYNGSEIVMRRIFDGTGCVYEAEYREAEALAFEQATVISVVSSEIRADLVVRGVDPAKILVNPNGVDLDVYAPPTSEQREEIRRSLGFASSDRVIGFAGTFGGWHGVEVLRDTIPAVCQKSPHTKFLLIGDGRLKHIVDDVVRSSGLEARVVSTGRVAQADGARLLKACDLYLSPHSVHGIDSRFFGSPATVFEFMALAGGIVASDLEQIGQALSPALTPDEAASGVPVTDERAVLCTPGNVAEFTTSVVALTERPELARALGRNARRAAADYYSWTRHVANLWLHLKGNATAADTSPDLRNKPRGSGSAGAPTPRERIVATGDRYKDQVQRQWNNDPAGSHYVIQARAHTKEWFLEAERHRYGTYAPWMPETMEFDRHTGEAVLEIGGGMGTDLAQFALHGALVTDVDLSAGHLSLARENFAARGLEGEFVQQDAETLPFDDNRFDIVYSNGVLHHTPNTTHLVQEIFRVLKPGGRALVMVYAEDSLHYWRKLAWYIGLTEGQLRKYSMGEIMSRSVERSDNAAAHPLVKTYTRAGLRKLFGGFVEIEIQQRQLEADAVPRLLTSVPRRHLEAIMGWNLVIKARKPSRRVALPGSTGTGSQHRRVTTSYAARGQVPQLRNAHEPGPANPVRDDEELAAQPVNRA